MRFVLIILCFLTMSCEQTPPAMSQAQGSYTTQNNQNIDYQFLEYVERFYALAERYGVSPRTEISIQLVSNMDMNYGGLCYWTPTGPLEIHINDYYWYRMTAVEKEMIVFHELGHCALDRSHANTLLSNRQPRSLMHSTTWIDTGYYQANRPHYTRELFDDSVPSLRDGGTFSSGGIAVIKCDH